MTKDNLCFVDVKIFSFQIILQIISNYLLFVELLNFSMKHSKHFQMKRWRLAHLNRLVSLLQDKEPGGSFPLRTTRTDPMQTWLCRLKPIRVDQHLLGNCTFHFRNPNAARNFIGLDYFQRAQAWTNTNQQTDRKGGKLSRLLIPAGGGGRRAGAQGVKTKLLFPQATPYYSNYCSWQEPKTFITGLNM